MPSAIRLIPKLIILLLLLFLNEKTNKDGTSTGITTQIIKHYVWKT